MQPVVARHTLLRVVLTLETGRDEVPREPVGKVSHH